MNSAEESELRISILRALAGNPRTFKAREVLDIIRGEGERVGESEFIRVFTELTQTGLVEVADGVSGGCGSSRSGCGATFPNNPQGR